MNDLEIERSREADREPLSTTEKESVDGRGLIVLTGRVHPERAGVSISNTPPTLVPLLGTTCEITTRVHSSQAVCWVKSAPVAAEMILIKNVVADVVQYQLDLLGFANNCGYLFEVTTALDNSCIEYVFGVHEGRDVAPSEMGQTFRDNYLLAHRYPPLRHALADLRSALLFPRDAAHYSYRGMESIRSMFWESEEEETRAESWAEMRRCLRVSEEWIGRTQALALPARHGKPQKVVTKEGRNRVLEDLREVVRRTFEYLRSDRTPLDASKFPELV